ncbi:MAG: hypothetical protein ACK5X3_01490 [Pseudomonadota bacterium]|jgi:hypothetical protein
MSDNVGYTPGSGATVAADNIGGALHQRVKISVGADGTAADASADNPVPVTAVAELMEAIEALRFAVARLTKTIGFALPNALGQPIFEARQATAANLQMTATQGGTWNFATLTSLTNQAQIGGFAANDVLPAFFAMRTQNLRRNITVT